MSYVNTRTTLGEQETLDKLIAHELTSFIDNDVTSLRQYAFKNQASLEEIVLPNIGSIPNYAFDGCTGMKRFILATDLNTTITLSNKNAFNNTGRSLIFVRDDKVDSYKAANRWKDFAARIRGIGDINNITPWNPTEISDSWDTILANVANGTAASLYTVGDYKSIDLGTEGTINFQIIGKNKDELAESTDKAQLTWFPMKLLNNTHRMNPALSNNTEGTGTIGGMVHCEGQTYLDETIWTLIPEAIRGAIKSVKKYTTIYNASGTKVQNDLTTQKLFYLSFREAFGGTTCESLGPVYDDAFLVDNDRIRYRGSSANGWWLRSAFSTSYFYVVSNNGNSNFNDANSTYGVAFGFCT